MVFVLNCFAQLIRVGYFFGQVGGREEKWGLKLSSPKVEVEVEAELGNMKIICQNYKVIQDQTYFCVYLVCTSWKLWPYLVYNYLAKNSCRIYNNILVIMFLYWSYRYQYTTRKINTNSLSN